MSELRRDFIKVLLASFSLSLIFYLFPPHLKGSELAQHRRQFLEWSNIKKQTREVGHCVNSSIKNQPFKEWGFQYFIRAPFAEELTFRGLFVLIPVLLLPRGKTILKINWVTVLLWTIMSVSGYYWTLNHDYPLLPQAIVMWGGLINGACIIHAPHTMRGKACGMLAAILLHCLANIFYVILFVTFF